MAKADLSTPRPLRIGVVVLITLIHVAVFLALLRAFAPGVVNQVVENVTSAIHVTITTPTPTPEPTAEVPGARGEEGAAGGEAKPREVTAPKPKVVIATAPAPQVRSTGDDNRSGARDAGEGTGAGGAGVGTGAGGTGSGQGGGMAIKAEKVAGDINSARDYPREGRDARIGSSVVIAITVGTDGQPKGCRVARASPDAAADRITCELAMKRFRFRPATNAAGQPVESVYGWQQRWFYKSGD
jgi:periplasmic protein TonB